MNKLQKRLARLDSKVKKIIPLEPEFICWTGDPWTPEQEALALRRYPHGKQFWRPLMPEYAKDKVLRCDVWPEAEPIE